MTSTNDDDPKQGQPEDDQDLYDAILPPDSAPEKPDLDDPAGSGFVAAPLPEEASAPDDDAVADISPPTVDDIDVEPDDDLSLSDDLDGPAVEPAESSPPTDEAEDDAPTDAAEPGPDGLASDEPTPDEPSPTETPAPDPKVLNIRGRTGGIDLGTTRTTFSYYDAGFDRVVTANLNQRGGGKCTMPSVVYYPAEGAPAVGVTAQNMAKAFPDRVIDQVKRSMGDAWKKEIDGAAHTPESVSSDVLTGLMADVTQTLGEVEGVVITVPAHFEDAARNATREAGTMAGLNVIALLPEPHAAALAFSVDMIAEEAESEHENLFNKDIIVFDLGGGTTDVALVRLNQNEADGQRLVQFETLAKEGDHRCGGVDWNNALQDLVLEKLESDGHDDLADEFRNDPMKVAMLAEQVEGLKCTLTDVDPGTIVVGSQMVEITRQEFETATAGWLNKAIALLEAVYDMAEKDHKLSRDQIIPVMTGGSTLMPQVTPRVAQIATREPLLYKNPDTLVSIGAAYWAHLLTTGVIEVGDIVIGAPDDGGVKDIVPYAVGVEVVLPDTGADQPAGSGFGMISPVGAVQGQAGELFENQLDAFLQKALGVFRTTGELPDNDTNNGLFARMFYKAVDGMDSLGIRVFRSKSDEAPLAQCQGIGNFTIVGLPSDGKFGDPVLVVLGHDSDGILHGKSVDVESGQSEMILIQRPTDMT